MVKKCIGGRVSALNSAGELTALPRTPNCTKVERRGKGKVLEGGEKGKGMG